MKQLTANQVSNTYNISTRMLRYYEQNGILESIRKDDYAYRVYDEANIKRLQQIILLRKLQIPLKQIRAILNNPDAEIAIEIFKSNISELENEITALATIKSALEIFVDKIEEIAAVQLNLDLLNDDSVLEFADSLSLAQRNVNENKVLAELNKASESLAKTRHNIVRLAHRPTETVAKFRCEENDPPNDEAKATMEKFIRETDLFNLMPNFKVFSHGFGTRNGSDFFVTIPSDLKVPSPFVKEQFKGGLWAVATVTKENNDGWAALDEWENEDYVRDYSRPRHEVYFNPLNILGLKNTDQFNTVFNPYYLDIYCPMKETAKVWSDEEQAAAAAKLEELALAGKTTSIELSSLTKIKDANVVETQEGGTVIIKSLKSQRNESKGLATPNKFNLPLKIKLRAKTNSTDIILTCAKSTLVYNHHHFRDKLTLFDDDGILHGEKIKPVVDEFIDFEWILGKNETVAKVNGKMCYFSSHNAYHRDLGEHTNFSSDVVLNSMFDAAVTIESLSVTEFSEV